VLLWQIVNFAGMALVFVGAVLLALFGSSFRVKDNHLEVKTERAKLATKVQLLGLWVFTVGFMLQLFYQTHLLL